MRVVRVAIEVETHPRELISLFITQRSTCFRNVSNWEQSAAAGQVETASISLPKGGRVNRGQGKLLLTLS